MIVHHVEVDHVGARRQNRGHFIAEPREVCGQDARGNPESSQTQYVAEQSDEQNGRYVFAYTMTIRNTGSIPAQLISRRWIITDGRNQVQEVRGLGVVGAQPLLKPGESFEYTSGTAIATPVGTMRGSYQMVAEDGTQFDATIPEFTLSVPRVLH